MITKMPVIQGNLAYDYVSDIPWDSTPVFAFSGHTDKYLEAFRNVVDKVPTRDLKISFADNIWDFNPYYDGINSDSYKLNFIDFPDSIRDYIKFYVLHAIMGSSKISTANARISMFKSIIIRLMPAPDSKITLLTTDDFCQYIDGKDISATGKHDLYISSFLLLSFIKNNYRLPLLVDLAFLKKRAAEEKRLSKEEASKLPDIPKEYFNAILNTAIKVMRDKDAEYNRRATACEIVMLSQLGLRLGDLLALRCEDRFKKVLPGSGHKVAYIHYRSRKPSKPHDKMLEFDIFCTELCSEAIDILIKLRKKNPLSKDNDYLYVPLAGCNTKNDLPATNPKFNTQYKYFLYEELKDKALLDWEGISKTLYRPRGTRGNKEDMVSLSVPDTRQFRVHLCTTLYNDYNVPLEFIRRYMGHLSEYMMGYYVRPKDTYQEDIAYAEKAIREIAGEEDLRLLGGSSPDDLKENIKKFIAENKIDVMIDTKAVVDAFGDKLIIRGKRGGMCIKTSILPCAKDRRSNALYCSYNLCPNLFHFFYMADASYADFKTLQETYQAAKDRGHTREAEKELYKLRDLCGKTLIPELDELQRELDRKGVTHIIEHYPSLLPIIEDMENIRKEVSEWMTIK